MNLRKNNYKHKIKTFEEALENRFQYIRLQREQTLKDRAIEFKSRTKIQIERSQTDFEEDLMDGDL